MKSRHISPRTKSREGGHGAPSLACCWRCCSPRAAPVGLHTAPCGRAADALPPVRRPTACIAGTIRTEEDPVADVDVTVTDPDGNRETVTSDDDGKWNLQVTEAGEYTVTLDEDTLPERIELEVRGVPERTVTVKLEGKQRVYVRPSSRSARTTFDAGTSKFDQLIQSTVNGLRLGLLLALASVGLSLIYGTTGLSNFAHAEQVTLGGILAYGFINLAGLGLWLGGVRHGRSPARLHGLLPGPGDVAAVATAGPRPDPDDDRDDRPVAGDAVHLPVLRRRRHGEGRGQDTGEVDDDRAGHVDQPVAGRDGHLDRDDRGGRLRAAAHPDRPGDAGGVGQPGARRGVRHRRGQGDPAGLDGRMGLAGLSGLLYALVVSNGIRWDTGLQILLLLFAAVTLGGLGTAFGALVGSLIIGLVVELAGPLGAPGDLKYAVALGMLILLLLVRPQGLLGSARTRSAEKED